MPFKSEAQRRFLYAKHPDIAKRWSEEAKSMEAKHMMPGMPPKEMKGKSMDKKKARMKAVKKALKKGGK